MHTLPPFSTFIIWHVNYIYKNPRNIHTHACFHLAAPFLPRTSEGLSSAPQLISLWQTGCARKLHPTAATGGAPGSKRGQNRSYVWLLKLVFGSDVRWRDKVIVLRVWCCYKGVSGFRNAPAPKGNRPTNLQMADEPAVPWSALEKTCEPQVTKLMNGIF